MSEYEEYGKVHCLWSKLKEKSCTHCLSRPPTARKKLQSQINQPKGWAHNHNCTTNTHNYKNYKATWQPTEGLGPAPLHHLMSASRALLLATEVAPCSLLLARLLATEVSVPDSRRSAIVLTALDVVAPSLQSSSPLSSLRRLVVEFGANATASFKI